MKNLQEIINKRAEDRAKADFEKIAYQIRNAPYQLRDLFNTIEIVVAEKEDGIPIKRGLTSVLSNSTNSNIIVNLIEKLTERYIPEESKIFVRQVDRLTEEIEDLKNYKHESH